MTLQKLFLTFGGSGLSQKAPGTMGTLASIPLGVFILYYFDAQTLFMLTFTITIIAIFEINKYEAEVGEHDSQEIVIDETAGVWLTMIIAYPTVQSLNFPFIDMIFIILSFATFRLFDIWKPSTIGWIDREVNGGLGVMGDDLLAGVAAGMLSIVLLIAIDKII
jgi:phosphatidylglycerophosphatase A